MEGVEPPLKNSVGRPRLPFHTHFDVLPQKANKNDHFCVCKYCLEYQLGSLPREEATDKIRFRYSRKTCETHMIKCIHMRNRGISAEQYISDSINSIQGQDMNPTEGDVANPPVKKKKLSTHKKKLNPPAALVEIKNKLSDLAMRYNLPGAFLEDKATMEIFHALSSGYPLQEQHLQAMQAQNGIALLPSAEEALKHSMQQYYSEAFQASKYLLPHTASVAIDLPRKAPSLEVVGAAKLVPPEVVEKFHGRGDPVPVGFGSHLPHAALSAAVGGAEGFGGGRRVLDLGCGSGRDSYVAAKFVGAEGHVIGVDVVEAQLAVARAHAESYCREVLGLPRCNLTFMRGEPEDLAAVGVGDASVDLVISNCVINLSPNKPRVFAEAFRVLAPGGEMHFADVFSDRRLPAACRAHPTLLGEGLSGLLYVHDFLRLMHQVGFVDPRELERSEIQIHDPQLKLVVGEIRFYIITYRLFKVDTLGGLPPLEPPPAEDYGHVATYLGTLRGAPCVYALDAAHRFEAHRPVLVSGNTASMLRQTWLRGHFLLQGSRERHFGAFASGAAAAAVAVDVVGSDNNNDNNNNNNDGSGSGKVEDKVRVHDDDDVGGGGSGSGFGDDLDVDAAARRDKAV